jgi:hypothetical protein
MARSGFHQEAAAFLGRTSAVTWLGPYGQAHGVGGRMNDTGMNDTTPYKPFEFTLFNEPCGFDYVEIIIGSIFGLTPSETKPLLKAATLPLSDVSVPR